MFALGIGVVGTGTASANPPGIPAGEKMEFKFNLIGRPAGQDYTGGCGNGGRIFVNRDANQEKLIIKDGTNWNIVDCDATGGSIATIESADLGTFHVYARILGKPGGRLKICADILEDLDTQEFLCALGTFELNRDGSKSVFKIVPDALFDASLADIIWTIDTNADFRIAQFRVYRAQ
jgi:hypothetical protein